MATSATLTIRLEPEVKAGLTARARATRRSRSFLAAEAVAAYVAREASIIAGIEEGLADAAAVRVVPHDGAMDELEGVIEAAIRRRS